MAERKLPPQDYLNQLLRYDAEAGKLYWLPRSGDSFNCKQDAARWNGRFAGKEAFTGIHQYGYAHGRIDGVRYTAHRVVFKMVYGYDPSEVDHINGNRADFRIANLREVTRTENARNQKLRKVNTSGVSGVMWHKASNKWLAKIGVDFKVRHLGLFDAFEEAVAARKAAETQYGFHENHGKAA